MSSMAEKKNVHTVPTDSGWANRREGAKRASANYDTKAEAEAAGRAAAKKDGVEHLIHRKDGTSLKTDADESAPAKHVEVSRVLPFRRHRTFPRSRPAGTLRAQRVGSDR